jgi:hypothetical protein
MTVSMRPPSVGTGRSPKAIWGGGVTVEDGDGDGGPEVRRARLTASTRHALGAAPGRATVLGGVIESADTAVSYRHGLRPGPASTNCAI